MITRILDLLVGKTPPKPLPEADGRHLLGALMLRIAQLDSKLTLAELQAIDKIFATQFGLTAIAAAKMRADCERLAEALPPTDTLGPMLIERLSPQERLTLASSLFTVAEADGEIDPREEAMITAVAQLLQTAT